MEKGDQSVLLRRGEMKRADLGTAVGIHPASLIVELDDVRQPGEAAVVHVGCGACHFAQRRRLECAPVFAPAADRKPPFVVQTTVPPGDASIVRTFVGEGRADMARSAVALPSENLQPCLLLGRKRRAVAVDEAIVRRIAREDASDVAGQRVCHRRGVQTDARRGFLDREVHFVRILNGFEHLLLERR